MQSHSNTFGGEGQDRTDDLRVMNPALSPAELHHLGVSDGDRTHAYWNHNPGPYHLATDTIWKHTSLQDYY